MVKNKNKIAKKLHLILFFFKVGYYFKQKMHSIFINNSYTKIQFGKFVASMLLWGFI